MEKTITIAICTGEVITPPVEMRNNIIREKHESCLAGHKGITKTYQRIRLHYYWENMKKEIQEYVRMQRMPVKEINKNKDEATDGTHKHTR